MRTRVVDTNARRFTFSGFFNGAASGWGRAGDVPYRWVRTGAGDYTLTFDPSLYPIIMTVSSSVGQAAPIVANNGWGTCRLQSFSTLGALQDGVVHFSITTLASR